MSNHYRKYENEFDIFTRFYCLLMWIISLLGFKFKSSSWKRRPVSKYLMKKFERIYLCLLKLKIRKIKK